MLKFPNDEFAAAHRLAKKDCIGDDVVIFYDVHHIPYFDFPYQTEHTIVTFCQCGFARGTSNLSDVCIRQDQLLVLLPGHVITFSEMSPDFKAMVILLSPYVNEILRNQIKINLHLRFMQEPVLEPAPDEWTVIENGFSMLQNIIRLNDTERRLDMAIQVFRFMGSLVSEDRLFRGMRKVRTSRRAHIFDAFIEELYAHFRQEREVQYYADRLSITANYLSKICREFTGQSANELISRQVMVQAQALLNGCRDKTVQQIAMELGFPNQSFFGKFFKKHAGVSPSRYRKITPPHA